LGSQVGAIVVQPHGFAPQERAGIPPQADAPLRPPRPRPRREQPPARPLQRLAAPRLPRRAAQPEDRPGDPARPLEAIMQRSRLIALARQSRPGRREGGGGADPLPTRGRRQHRRAQRLRGDAGGEV